MLDPPSQGAATQQHVVHIQQAWTPREYHRADQSVIAKPVAKSYHQALRIPRYAQLFDFVFRTPDTCEIKLVCSLRDLCDPRQFRSRHRKELELKFKPGKKIFQAHRLRRQLFSLGVLGIEITSFPIFFRNLEMIECPDVRQKSLEVGVLLGQLQGERFRATGLNLRALYRAIVQENEAVQSELQFRRERSKIFRLGSPIDSRGNEMFPLENHAGVFLKNAPHIFSIILATKTHQHPGITLTNYEFL
jgi:hypothetical protein